MALAPLAPFVAALVALGLAVLMTLLTLALVRFFASAPYIGGWLANKAAAVEQAILNALGSAFSGIDQFIGHCIHTLSRFFDGLWHDIELTAANVARVANLQSVIAHAMHGVKVASHAVAKAAHGIDAVVRDLEKEYHGIEHRVRSLAREIHRGIGHDLRLGLRKAEKDIAHIENHVVPSIREAEAQAAKAIENLYAWARGAASLIGVGTFAFAVTAVLADLFGSFLRCAAWKGVFNRLTCGMGQLLLDLLDGLIAVMVVEDICAITHLAIEVAESGPVQAFLTDTVGSMDDLLTCQGVSVAPGLAGPYFAPPPVQPPAALAA